MLRAEQTVGKGPLSCPSSSSRVLLLAPKHCSLSPPPPPYTARVFHRVFKER